MQIELMQKRDWKAVRTIYEEGIATGHATFETNVHGWRAWDSRHHRRCRFVVRTNDDIVGWCALSGVSARAVYRGVAEVSIYIAESVRGQGVGKALLIRVIEESEKIGIWTLQAGIFPENRASIALHISCGFKEIGRRERLGRLKGVWRDVVLLERRSDRVGIEETISS
jgi:L-amino acid N-acyltransferase YncA